jgi:hypothetical protein
MMGSCKTHSGYPGNRLPTKMTSAAGGVPSTDSTSFAASASIATHVSPPANSVGSALLQSGELLPVPVRQINETSATHHPQSLSMPFSPGEFGHLNAGAASPMMT